MIRMSLISNPSFCKEFQYQVRKIIAYSSDDSELTKRNLEFNNDKEDNP